MTNSPSFVNCPSCNKLISWSEDNAFRPFCSERCKLIDLGEWVSENYTIQDEKDEASGTPFEQSEPTDIPGE